MLLQLPREAATACRGKGKRGTYLYSINLSCRVDPGTTNDENGLTPVGERAIMVVIHSILVNIHHLLHCGTSYQDLGGNYFKQRDRQYALRRAVHPIGSLGYKITLEAA